MQPGVTQRDGGLEGSSNGHAGPVGGLGHGRLADSRPASKAYYREHEQRGRPQGWPDDSTQAPPPDFAEEDGRCGCCYDPVANPDDAHSRSGNRHGPSCSVARVEQKILPRSQMPNQFPELVPYLKRVRIATTQQLSVNYLVRGSEWSPGRHPVRRSPRATSPNRPVNRRAHPSVRCDWVTVALDACRGGSLPATAMPPTNLTPTPSAPAAPAPATRLIASVR